MCTTKHVFCASESHLKCCYTFASTAPVFLFSYRSTSDPVRALILMTALTPATETCARYCLNTLRREPVSSSVSHTVRRLRADSKERVHEERHVGWWLERLAPDEQRSIVCQRRGIEHNPLRSTFCRIQQRKCLRSLNRRNSLCGVFEWRGDFVIDIDE